MGGITLVCIIESFVDTIWSVTFGFEMTTLDCKSTTLDCNRSHLKSYKSIALLCVSTKDQTIHFNMVLPYIEIQVLIAVFKNSENPGTQPCNYSSPMRTIKEFKKDLSC